MTTYAIQRKLDGTDVETGTFERESEALKFWFSWLDDHPGERGTEWHLVERDTGRVVATMDVQGG